MSLSITVRTKNVYGTTLLYPESAHAKALADLLGMSTLTPQALDKARRGLDANVVILTGRAPSLESLLAGDTAP